jgi:hypothetical protein
MPNKKPIFRVTFCPHDGKDDQGRDKLSKRSVEIGAVWATSSGKSNILRLNLIPENLKAGAIFLNPITTKEKGFA